MPTWFLAPIAGLKLPTQNIFFEKGKRGEEVREKVL
jgi:hypothetical protein